MTSRLLSIIIAALLLAASLAAVPAGAAGVFLRYRFINGQTITYRVTATSQLTGSEGNKASPSTTDKQAYQVHYVFSNIAEGGGAVLTMRTDRFIDRATQAGKTLQSPVPASVQQFFQQADGRQYTPDLRSFGAYSNGDLGALPAQPVDIGGSWNSTLTDRGPIFKPSTTVACTNTLTGFTKTSERVAAISTSCAISGHGQVTQHGKNYRFASSDVFSGRWQFGVTSGRFLSQVLHETVRETGTVTDTHGTRPFVQSSTQTLVQQIISPVLPPGSGSGSSV